jgi:glyoxylate carboligase
MITLMAGMHRIAPHRYGNATMLGSDFVLASAIAGLTGTG